MGAEHPQSQEKDQPGEPVGTAGALAVLACGSWPPVEPPAPLHGRNVFWCVLAPRELILTKEITRAQLCAVLIESHVNATA